MDFTTNPLRLSDFLRFGLLRPSDRLWSLGTPFVGEGLGVRAYLAID
ncbi:MULTISPECIES: hypothetical protein [Oscillatoriales]|nr:hypothetical protein [Arthrospira platensis NCB002]MDT9309539.1 hypothetical protein [Limnospira sp. Paracas R14]QQW28107.1 hypothetical protein AP9108_23915 [Arthrospira sp. PCC 9108]